MKFYKNPDTGEIHNEKTWQLLGENLEDMVLIELDELGSWREVECK